MVTWLTTGNAIFSGFCTIILGLRYAKLTITIKKKPVTDFLSEICNFKISILINNITMTVISILVMVATRSNDILWTKSDDKERDQHKLRY